MILAVKTHASPVEIWAIVIVAVSCLTFWLSMVIRADRQQVRASGLTPGLPSVPVVPGQAGLGHAEGQDEYDFSAGYEIPAQRVPAESSASALAAEAPTEPIPADAPTRPDLPAQTGEPMPGMPVVEMPAPKMPAQRSGEGDRAERSGAADRDRGLGRRIREIG
jgi:hypothetical protein